MTKRIFRSICLAVFAVCFASIALIMGVLYEYFSLVQRSQLKMQTELAVQGVEIEGSAYFEGLDAQNYRITWIDADGEVLYDSQTGDREMENHLEREEIREALRDGYGESWRYSATLMERSLYAAKLLADGTVLRLSVSQSTIFTLVLGMAQPIAVIFAVALVLSGLLAKHLAANVVKPLNAIDLERPLKNDAYEELSPLLRRIASQQRQLRQAEQMRREFTANVSHELRTPLHCISGYAELLKNGMVKPEDTAAFSERVYAEAQRMIALVDDIIHLSHLDEGTGDMEWEEIDLYAVSEQTVRELTPKAEKAKVSFNMEGEHGRFFGILQLVSGILFNLCDNAVKYNRENGSVSVRIEEAPEAVVLTVADTGIGIPEEHRERIFERFYRVDKSHSKEVGGTGLGLSIVKHGARLLGAAVELHSEVGVGTTVTVRFPKNRSMQNG